MSRVLGLSRGDLTRGPGPAVRYIESRHWDCGEWVPILAGPFSRGKARKMLRHYADMFGVAVITVWDRWGRIGVKRRLYR